VRAGDPLAQRATENRGSVHSLDFFFSSFNSSFIIFRSARLIRVW
jgi:hypothetical protein